VPLLWDVSTRNLRLPIIELPKRGNGADIAKAGEARGLSLSALQKLSDYIRAKRVAIEAVDIVEKLKGPALTLVQKAGGIVVLNGAILRDVMSVSYKYPPAIEREEAKLMRLKKIMQLDGRAQKIEKPCLTLSDAP
jgi:hypothetical protein